MPPAYLRRSRWLELKTLGDLFQCVRGASAMERRRTVKLVRNSYRISTTLNHSTLKMDRIVLLEYVVTADDLNINYLQRRQLSACLRNSAQLRNAWDSL